MPSILVKSFQELSKLELYNILKLRAEVFIVEQNCVYQDIDDKDFKALHVFLKQSDQIVKISAQTYLKNFYNSFGFYEKGNEYLEDGIPHIAMLKE